MTAELGQAPDGPTPFVFATVGTDHHPFSRLVEAVDAWAARTGLPVFIQSGTSDPPKHCRHSSLVPYAEMQTMLSSAMGREPWRSATIVRSRRQEAPDRHACDPALGEHVDDYRIRFARRRREEVVLAETAADLEAALEDLVAAHTFARSESQGTPGPWSSSNGSSTRSYAAEEPRARSTEHEDDHHPGEERGSRDGGQAPSSASDCLAAAVGALRVPPAVGLGPVELHMVDSRPAGRDPPAAASDGQGPAGNRDMDRVPGVGRPVGRPGGLRIDGRSLRLPGQHLPGCRGLVRVRLQPLADPGGGAPTVARRRHVLGLSDRVGIRRFGDSPGRVPERPRDRPAAIDRQPGVRATAHPSHNGPAPDLPRVPGAPTGGAVHLHQHMGIQRGPARSGLLLHAPNPRGVARGVWGSWSPALRWFRSSTR